MAATRTASVMMWTFLGLGSVLVLGSGGLLWSGKSFKRQARATEGVVTTVWERRGVCTRFAIDFMVRGKEQTAQITPAWFTTSIYSGKPVRILYRADAPEQAVLAGFWQQYSTGLFVLLGGVVCLGIGVWSLLEVRKAAAARRTFDRPVHPVRHAASTIILRRQTRPAPETESVSA